MKTDLSGSRIGWMVVATKRYETPGPPSSTVFYKLWMERNTLKPSSVSLVKEDELGWSHKKTCLAKEPEKVKGIRYCRICMGDNAIRWGGGEWHLFIFCPARWTMLLAARHTTTFLPSIYICRVISQSQASWQYKPLKNVNINRSA